MSQNGSTPVTPTKEGEEVVTLPTKLCHIVKRADFDGYGFNLHSEKSKPGQYIGKVDANSPAEEAGLKEGDRIIEVNGSAIGNETHKQVVQRIKAISCEVRLLLVDESAKDGSSTTQHIPGSSSNISSISMTTTKRSSNGSNNSSNSNNTEMRTSTDVTDHALLSSQNGQRQQQPPPPQQQQIHAFQGPKDTNHNENMKTPPPPSAAVATVMSNNNSKNNNSKDGLQLPTTAAEMRAKLLSKKKYDPKNESVDLKKKFEIIQKL